MLVIIISELRKVLANQANILSDVHGICRFVCCGTQSMWKDPT